MLAAGNGEIQLGFMVKVRCGWEQHLPPASIGSPLTSRLGEMASFVLTKLG